MKKFLIVWAFISSCISVAQYNVHEDIYFNVPKANIKDTIENSIKKKTIAKKPIYVGLNSAFHFQSDILTNSILKDATTGDQFITQDSKEDAFKKIKNNNRSGLDYSLGLKVIVPIKKNLYATGSFEHRTFFGSKFNGNLLKILLDGNSKTAGEKFEMGNISLDQQVFQSVKLGLYHDHGSFMGGFVLGLVKGEFMREISADELSFYTKTDGTNIEIASTNLNFKNSDRGTNSFDSFEGWGASLGLFFQKSFDSGWKFSIKAEDLGFINWKGVHTLNFQNQYSFSGLEITDLNNISDSLFEFEDLSVESVLDAQETEQAHYSKMLPGYIQLDAQKSFGNIDALAGIKYQFSNGYLPQAYIKGLYNFKFGLQTGLILMYGGYGNSDYGLCLGYEWNNKLFFRSNIFMLEPYISPKNTAGQGYSLVLGIKL